MKTNLTKNQILSIAMVIVIGILLGAFILMTDKVKPTTDEHGHGHGGKEEAHDNHGKEKNSDKHDHAEEHGHSDHPENEQAKGPHGGCLLVEDQFGLEILLAEDAGEPRFRIYLFEKDKPLPINAAKVSVTLIRADGEKQEIAFTPANDHFISTVKIAEPHSFEATIAVQTANEPYLFTFTKDEGKIQLSDAQIKASGITLLAANPSTIKTSITLPGEIHFNEDRTAHVVPRLTGVVENVRADLGQKVMKGQVLATLASTDLAEQRSELLTAQKRLALARITYEREKKLWQEKISAEQDYLQAQQVMHETEIAVRNAQQKLIALGADVRGAGPLNKYEIRAPFDAVVVEKHISLGEVVKEDANVFTLSDLTTVWAEVAVPAKDLNSIRIGEKVTVNASAFSAKTVGTISYLGSLLGEETRTAKARVVLDNPDMAWRPGLFVNVEVTSNDAQVPIAVSTEAIHMINDHPTLFVRVADGFIPLTVKLGGTDGKLVEVIKGIKPGSQYAGPGSFILKSELGKASAEHAH